MIGSTGTETPFLAESELPECARLSNRQMEGKSASELEDQQLAEALAKRYKNSSNDMYIFQEIFFCKRTKFRDVRIKYLFYPSFIVKLKWAKKKNSKTKIFSVVTNFLKVCFYFQVLNPKFFP